MSPDTDTDDPADMTAEERRVQQGIEQRKKKRESASAPFDPVEDDPRSSRLVKIKDVYDRLLEEDREEAAEELRNADRLLEQKNIANEHLAEWQDS